MCVCVYVRGSPIFFFSLSLARARTDVCMLEQSRQGGLVHSALLAVDKQDQDAQVCVHVSASARTLSQTLFFSLSLLSLSHSLLARSLSFARALPPRSRVGRRLLWRRPSTVRQRHRKVRK